MISDTEDDPRAELEKNYTMNGELPASVSKKAFLKRQNSIRSENDDAYDNERDIITQMLHDSRITLAQRESISASILNGKYQIRNDNKMDSPPKKNIQRTEKEISNTRNNFINLNRHNLRKPHFLEIITESTKIPIVSAKEIHQSKISLIRAKGNEGKEHQLPSPKQKKILEPSQSAKEIQNKLIAEDKMVKLKATKEFALQCREEALRQKKLEMESTEKKVEIKKRLADFRQKLKDHLQKRHDPQVGDIMRCVDDSMVYHFMEKYEGYSMSVEAILALIGNSLGSSTVRPDPMVLSTERDLLGNTKRHRRGGKSDADEDKAECLYIHDVAQSYQRGKDPHSRSMNSIIFDTSFGKPPRVDSSRSKSRKGLADTVLGIAPRKYTTELISPLVAEKTLGSGFRTKSRGSSRSSHSNTGILTPLDAPMFRHDNKVEMSHHYPSLAVLGSEHLRNSIEFMESTNHFDAGSPTMPSGKSIRSGIQSTPSAHTIQSMHGRRSSHAEDDEMSVGTQEAISVMHEQLLEEKLLPSMRPERPLSESQLHELGTKKKTFEDIMCEVQGGSAGLHSHASSQNMIVNQPMSAIKNARRGVRKDTYKNGDDHSQGSQRSHNTLYEEEDLLHAHNHTSSTLEENKSRVSSSEMLVFGSESRAYSSSPKKQLPLFGSVMSNEEKDRLDHLSPTELEYFRNSFGLAAKAPHEMSKDKYSSMSLTLNDSTSQPITLAQPPRGLKSRNKYESKDGLTYLPISPFKSFQEASHVLSNGVPAGSGLMLWRPRQKVTPSGRYRAGQASPLKAKDHKKHEQLPFVSMT